MDFSIPKLPVQFSLALTCIIACLVEHRLDTVVIKYSFGIGFFEFIAKCELDISLGVKMDSDNLATLLGSGNESDSSESNVEERPTISTKPRKRNEGKEGNSSLRTIGYEGDSSLRTIGYKSLSSRTG